MEKMPYQSELDMNVVIRPPMTDVTTTDWQHRLPTLTGHNVVLRELRTSDAQSLFAMLTTLMIPATVLAVPAFLTTLNMPIIHLNLTNTPWAIWLPSDWITTA